MAATPGLPPIRQSTQVLAPASRTRRICFSENLPVDSFARHGNT
jgi:hypothetical protein